MSTFVTRPGFEPRQAESESAVLPLYYRAIDRAANLKKKPIMIEWSNSFLDKIAYYSL